MPADMPAAVADFFAATNRDDPALLAACFAPDAEVHDEGMVHTGAAAIAAWSAATKRKYAHTAEVLDATAAGPVTTVAARVSGTFPGSPARLAFAFTLAGGRIARLEIGA